MFEIIYEIVEPEVTLASCTVSAVVSKRSHTTPSGGGVTAVGHRRHGLLRDQAVAAGRRLLIVVHSWGGDTALRVLRSLNPEFVDLLVCVDPVPKSRLNPPPTPRNARHIIHVDARPTRPNQSDSVKDLGQWIGGTLHRRLAIAHTQIVADLNHFAFAQMMASPDDNGLSAIDYINHLRDRFSGPRTANSSSAS